MKVLVIDNQSSHGYQERRNGIEKNLNAAGVTKAGEFVGVEKYTPETAGADLEKSQCVLLHSGNGEVALSTLVGKGNRIVVMFTGGVNGLRDEDDPQILRFSSPVGPDGNARWNLSILLDVVKKGEWTPELRAAFNNIDRKLEANLESFYSALAAVRPSESELESKHPGKDLDEKRKAFEDAEKARFAKLREELFGA